MAETVIRTCTCTSAYQDKKYGTGRRVMNVTKKDGRVRCTVCGNERGEK